MVWNLERNRALREYLASGLGYHAISQKLGISYKSTTGKINNLKNETDLATCERIGEMWLDGHRYGEIGDAIGIDKLTVRNVISRLGLLKAKRRPPAPLPRWNQAHDAILRELNAQGKSFKYIAKVTGFSSHTVSRNARRLGLERQPHPRKWTKERTAEFLALIGMGLSSGQIAKKMGITPNAAIGKANRLGIQFGRRKKQALPAIKTDGMCDLPEDRSATAVRFADLADGQCSWPMWGEGMDMFCCAEKTTYGSPYCAKHGGRRRRL